MIVKYLFLLQKNYNYNKKKTRIAVKSIVQSLRSIQNLNIMCRKNSEIDQLDSFWVGTSLEKKIFLKKYKIVFNMNVLIRL